MKKIINYKPTGFLGCLLIGILLQFYYKIWSYNFWYLVSVLCCLIILLFVLKQRKRKILFTSTSFLIFIFWGISSIYIQNPKNHKNYFLKNKKNNSTLIVSVTDVLKTNVYYDKYIVNVTQTDLIKTQGKLLLNIKKDSTRKKLNIDQQLFLKPILKEITPALNPHQFSYKNHLAKQHIYQQIFTETKNYVILKENNTSLFGVLARYRNKIQDSLKKHNFTKDEFSVINALLLGQRQEISKNLLNNYVKAGAIHILAISGLHIGIVLLFLSWLFYPITKLKHGTALKTILIICILWVFAFITGLSASVVRAVTMFTFIAIGNSLKRGKNTKHSLITSAFILLLINPMFLFDVGFQLSYLAVFSIVYTEPIISSIWRPKYIILNKIWKLFTVSIAAQIGILPLSLFYFHQFPGLFLLSNIIIIPFLGVILFCGIIVILLALFNYLPKTVVIVYNQIIKWMNTIVIWISEQEAFLFTKISLSIFMMVALYVFFITAFKFVINRKAKQLIHLLISIVLIQLVLIYESDNTNNKKEFIVFHKNKASIIGKRSGDQFLIEHNLDTLSINEKLITSYEIGENISAIIKNQNSLIQQFNKENILIIDSLGVYKLKGVKNPIIILQSSPKVNLNRVITLLEPKEIIADGSNYKSYINTWRETCKKQKTPFYYTGKNGAYIFK